MKASHADPKVNDQFIEWCDSKHGNFGPLTFKRGKIHDCLGMKLDYTEKEKLVVDMRDHVKDMLYGHLTQIKCNVFLWNDKLLKVDEDISLLPPQKAESCHSFVMKGMFLANRARPDKKPGIGFLSSRVKAPTQQDKTKLTKTL